MRTGSQSDHGWRPYLLAVLASMLAIAIRAAMDRLTGAYAPFGTAFLAVMAMAWFFNWRPALLSLFLGAAGTTWLYYHPASSVHLTGSAQVAGLIAFTCVSIAVIAMGEAYRHRQEEVLEALARSRAEGKRLASEIEARMRLQEASNRLVALVESSEDAIIGKDLRGTITHWNPAAERMYGYSAVEAVGRSIDILFPAEKMEEFRSIMDSLRHGRPVEHFETSRLRKDGTRLDVWLSMSPIKSPEGEVIGAAAIERDVTEKNRQEALLQETDKQFKRAAALAGIGAYEWDLATGRMRWFARTPSLQAMDSKDGTASWLDFVHPEDRELLLAAHFSPPGTGTPEEETDCEFRVVRPDGQILWLLSRAHRVPERNLGGAKAVGVLLDITDRKKAQDSLMRAEKMAVAGRLAASIAHEINNPLEALVNLIYLAQNDPASSASYMVAAQRELMRASELTRQTLGFYRSSSVRGRFSISRLLDEVLTFVSPRIDRNSVRVVRQYQPDLEWVGVESEIRQVLLNLVVNALDALPVGGALTVRTRRSGDEIRILVADNGQGIPPSSRSMIFEPFFTTKPETGTGLGLWVTKSIVEKHGGTLRFFSRANGSRTEAERSGTVFIITLPANTAVVSEAASVG